MEVEVEGGEAILYNTVQYGIGNTGTRAPKTLMPEAMAPEITDALDPTSPGSTSSTNCLSFVPALRG